jgi:hypothetical protein
MTVLTPTLHLLVALSMAAPLPADPSDCAADDLQCSARTFSAAARRAPSKVKQVEYLYFAHRSYLALSESPGGVPSRDLCHARRLVHQALALPATSLRPRLEESRRETLTRLTTKAIVCTPAKRPKGDNPPAVAVSEPLTDPGDLLASSAEEPPADALGTPLAGPIDSAKKVELPQRVTWTPEDRGAARPAHEPVGGAADRRDRPASPPPGRRLLVAGGVSLAAGLALTGTAAYTGAQALRSLRTGRENITLAATDENLNNDAALRAEYHRFGTAAVVTGVAAGSAVVAAIVMLCVGARRRGRATEGEPTLMPVRAGVLFTVPF